MDRRYIEDHHVVARYLANRLSDAEREEFEAYYLEHPQVVQEMEAAARFKAGLMELRDSGELSRLLRPAERPRQWRYLAAAAAVAVIAIGAFVIERTPNRPALVAASTQSPIASRHAILRTRGSSVDAEIPLPADAAAIELRVLPEFAAHPSRYRIQLFRMSADDSLQAVAELGGLEPAFDNFVTIFVDGARLQPGQYRLAISGDPDTDASDKESAFILRMQPTLTDPSATSH